MLNEVGSKGEKLQFNEMLYSDIGTLCSNPMDEKCLEGYVKLRNRTITACKILLKYCPWERAEIALKIIKQEDSDSLLYVKDITINTSDVLATGCRVLIDSWTLFCKMVCSESDALQTAWIDILSTQKVSIETYTSEDIGPEPIDKVASITFRFLAVKYHNTWDKPELIKQVEPNPVTPNKKKPLIKSKYTYDSDKDDIYSIGRR